MAGEGGIGGGSCCWVNFLVEDEKGVKRVHAFDMDTRDGDVITITFPKGATIGGRRIDQKDEVTVPLGEGTSVAIKWGGGVTKKVRA